MSGRATTKERTMAADSFMILAHCPETGDSYGVETWLGEYHTKAAAMFDRLLHLLCVDCVHPQGMVFDVLRRQSGSMLYRPFKQLSYAEAESVASSVMQESHP